MFQAAAKFLKSGSIYDEEARRNIADNSHCSLYRDLNYYFLFGLKKKSEIYRLLNSYYFLGYFVSSLRIVFSIPSFCPKLPIFVHSGSHPFLAQPYPDSYINFVKCVHTYYSLFCFVVRCALVRETASPSTIMALPRSWWDPIA